MGVSDATGVLDLETDRPRMAGRAVVAGVPAALTPPSPVEVAVPGRDAAVPDPSRRLRRVAAVIPCYNRRGDAEALLGDLSRVRLRGSAPGAAAPAPPGQSVEIDFRALLVDNASDQPLSSLAVPAGFRLEHLRLSVNTGGSGGYNAGMRRVLALDDENDEALAWRAWDAEYVWLVDSDARVAPDTLSTLLDVLESDPTIVAAGSAICDPVTGQAFELGGHVNRKNGNFEPMVTGNIGVRELVDADYVAACCALVRADAIRDTGVFPDRFLNGDDVEWFIRMKAMTGGRVVGVPWSVAMHPRFDRFATWPRYYMTRNAFGPIDAVRGEGSARGAALRRRRAFTEVPRAVQQAMMGRSDLAALHLAGLRHAAAHQTIGPAPAGLIRIEPTEPISRLAERLTAELGMGRRRPTQGRILARLMVSEAQRAEILDQLTRAGVVIRRGRDGTRPVGFVRALWGAARRFVLGPEVDVAVIPARGRPDSWFLGRLTVAVTPQGFVLRRPRRLGLAVRSLATLVAGVRHAWAVGSRGPDPQAAVCPWLHTADPAAIQAARRTDLRVCAIVLSHNRWSALERTLRGLGDSGLFDLDGGTVRAAASSGTADSAPWSVLVVDNASTDGTVQRLAESFPGVRTLALPENLGVEAFNRGVDQTDADAVLILDDDAMPDSRALRRAVELLARRPEVGAVALHPRHPRGGASEWSFAAEMEGRTTDRCPVMGCANLVRREAWKAAGGYEAGYFLYRNDTDLALKLLGLGYAVHFNPAWVAWHDTPAGAGSRKSLSWHRLATRNWIWMARRHRGRGERGQQGARLSRDALLGWLWSHRLAGLSLSRHWATLAGAAEGLRRPPPALDDRIRSGSAWRELMDLMMRR